eukprot:6878906-Ditylum_brightwellii.AAC.1
MHVDGMRCATGMSKCVIGTLTHPGAHVCALLETQSQPPAGNINNNIALLIKDLYRKIQLYDMSNTFNILNFDEQKLPTNEPAVHLFEHYKMLPLERIRQHCKYLAQCGSPYVVQNLKWSAVLILNSSETDLENMLNNKLLALTGLEQGGLVVFKLIMEIIFYVTDQALHLLISRIEK